MGDEEPAPHTEPPEAGAGYDNSGEGMAGEQAAMAASNKMNLQTAPIRTYLDSTVVPVLLQARGDRGARARVGRGSGSPPECARGGTRALTRAAPCVAQGLSALVKERPANPVEYLATYLLQNNPDKH